MGNSESQKSITHIETSQVRLTHSTQNQICDKFRNYIPEISLKGIWLLIVFALSAVAAICSNMNFLTLFATQGNYSENTFLCFRLKLHFC